MILPAKLGFYAMHKQQGDALDEPAIMHGEFGRLMAEIEAKDTVSQTPLVAQGEKSLSSSSTEGCSEFCDDLKKTIKPLLKFSENNGNHAKSDPAELGMSCREFSNDSTGLNRSMSDPHPLTIPSFLEDNLMNSKNENSNEVLVKSGMSEHVVPESLGELQNDDGFELKKEQNSIDSVEKGGVYFAINNSTIIEDLGKFRYSSEIASLNFMEKSFKNELYLEPTHMKEFTRIKGKSEGDIIFHASADGFRRIDAMLIGDRSGFSKIDKDFDLISVSNSSVSSSDHLGYVVSGKRDAMRLEHSAISSLEDVKADKVYSVSIQINNLQKTSFDQNHAQMPTVPMIVQAQLEKEIEREAELKALPEKIAELSGAAVTRVSAHMSGSVAPVFSSGLLSAPLAVQFSGALREALHGPVVLQLAPAELGKVRIAMMMTDNGMQVSIFAERVDTYDLMRRFASNLTDDLRDMGFDSLDLSFAHKGQDEEASGSNRQKGIFPEKLVLDPLNDGTVSASSPSAGCIDVRV